MATAGTLYLVGTPIGNLADLTERARGVLGSVDTVAAEDTRRTRALLTHLGLRARLVSLPSERERERIPVVLELLERGQDVALVTDAGMPGISDPGVALVAAAVERGIDVRVVPGPSAAVAAVVVSGLPSDRVAFEGFLPRKGRARTERLAAIGAEPRTTVVFESPRRAAATLRDLLEACGDRRAAVARELTKVHEEVLRGTLRDLAERLADQELRGEVAIVIEGAAPEPGGDEGAALAEARSLVVEGRRPREAAAEAAARHGVPTNAVYRAMVGDEDRPGGPAR